MKLKLSEELSGDSAESNSIGLMMNTAAWMGGVLLVLGGCSTHTPVVVSTSKPLETVLKYDSNQSILSDPFCSMLPQELELKLPEYGPKVNDLERFEQSITPYVERNGLDRENLLEIQTTFEGRYFSPWNYKTPPQKVYDVTWPLRAYKGGYGSNLKPVAPAWFESMQVMSNFEVYGSLNQKAIALKRMDLRAFPTDKPLYKDPSLPGEGYPFDLLQNSSINYNEPLFLSHQSKDGSWSYVFTNNASGWVPSDGVVAIEDSVALFLQKGEKLFLIEDNVPLNDGENRFVAYSRVGMVLPLERSEGQFYDVKVVESSGTIKRVSIPKESARIGVSRFNKSDMITIGTQMLKNTYGWGGMYGERDCSSMIRDMMTPFGIWLPRNSSSQSKKGEVVSFEGLSDEEKLSLIQEKGVPFETILYLKGHVLLYIGTYQENVMVMHNIWGIRTLDKLGKKGRHIIGKAVISTLELGSDLDNYDPEMKLLTRTESMNIFTKTPTAFVREIKNKGKKKSL
jgi:hypothetical protein